VRKWRVRARSGKAQWYRDESHAPHRPAHKCDAQWEDRVVATRQLLVARRESRSHAFIGSIAIRKELQEQGVAVEGHSLRQIERVLQRRDLVEPRQKRRRGGPKRFYPGPHNEAQQPWDLHEVDFVGPLYLRGGQRFQVLSRVDLVSGNPCSWVHRRQTADCVQISLWQDWQTAGRPLYLQMDNQTPFSGGHQHARSLGQVVRLCLYAGIQPVFIPFYCSFYNAHVESYHSRWEADVHQRIEVGTPDEFAAELQRYIDFFASYRAYERALRGRPNHHQGTRRLLPADIPQPKRMMLCYGRIHFIRRVSEEGRIEILNETFRVPRDFAHDYLWAIIDTQSETLSVQHQINKEQPPTVVLQVPYAFREKASQHSPLPGG
jgi:hypothetical protein